MSRLAAITVTRIAEPARAGRGAGAYDVAVKTSERDVPVDRKTGRLKEVRLTDGDNLYLIVEPTGASRWVFLFRWGGKLKEMGLGSLTKVPMKTARSNAQDARELLGKQINPIEAKHAKAAIPTFGELADELLGQIEESEKNAKHTAAWRRAIGAPREIKVRRAANGFLGSRSRHSPMLCVPCGWTRSPPGTC